MERNIVKAQSPLIEHQGTREEFSLKGQVDIVFKELPLRTHLNLRCEPHNMKALIGAEQVLEIALPTQPNTCEALESGRIFWLGPDEWLLVVAESQGTPLTQKLSEAWEPYFHSIVDVSGGQTVIRISGNKAVEVLNLGCTLDLHSSSFKVKSCAQSLIHGVPILLSRHTAADVPIFELVVRRSYADCLMRWLLDSATYHGFLSKVGVEESLAGIKDEKTP